MAVRGMCRQSVLKTTVVRLVYMVALGGSQSECLLLLVITCVYVFFHFVVRSQTVQIFQSVILT